MFDTTGTPMLYLIYIQIAILLLQKSAALSDKHQKTDIMYILLN